MQAENASYDCVIVGGGAVGASLALALAKLSYKVCVLEKEKKSVYTGEPFAARTVGLSYASARIFSALGLEALFQHHAVPIKNVRVSVKGQFGSSYLRARDQSVNALGWVVGLGDLEAALYHKISQEPQLAVYQDTQIIGRKSHPDYWDLTIQTGLESKKITCKLLVAADGAASLLRAEQGIHCEKKEYDHYGVMANVQIIDGPMHTAVERFLPEGAIALLPWQQNYATCVWTADSVQTEKLKALSDSAFMMACQAQLGRRFGRLISVAKRACYPLQSLVASQQVGARFLLMGNAAHNLHPVAAQGLNLSLRDIWQLYSQISKAKIPLDLGDPLFLQEYIAARKADQQRIIFATDKIAYYMSGKKLPSWLRALGITVFDEIKPLKQQFTRYSMGLS